MAKVTRLRTLQSLASTIRTAQQRLLALRQEHGIIELEDEISQAKKALASQMVEENIEALPGDGFHVTLRQDVLKRGYVLDSKEWEGSAPKTPSTLRRIVRAKFRSEPAVHKEVWNMITKRVPDPDGIEQAISLGLLTMEEVEQAYFETYKSPYVRFYDEGEEE